MTAISGIRIFLSVIYLSGLAVINGEPLSASENQQRQETCGDFNLPMPAADVYGKVFNYTNEENTWLLTVRPKSRVQFPNTTAFLTSPRHIMTSAQVLLTVNQNWLVNGKKIEKNCSVGDHGGFIEIPIDALETLEVWNPKKALDLEIVKARFFYLCKGDFHVLSAPLLLEIRESLKCFPCLTDKKYSSNIKQGVVVHSYGLGANGQMKHHKTKITNEIDPTWLYTEKYFEGGNDRGGPLVHIHKNRTTVIGLKASDPSDRSQGVYFYNIFNFEKEICEFSGVCDTNLTTTTVSTIIVTSRGNLDLLQLTSRGNLDRTYSDSTLNVFQPSVISINPSIDALNDGSDDLFVSADFNHTNSRKLGLIDMLIIFYLYWNI